MRIQIRAYHIGHLLKELRISRQLEGFRAMGLQIMGAPDVVHRGLAYALVLRQRPATLECVIPAGLV